MPEDLMKVDVCVIGAGSAGLTAAGGAVMLGRKTVLIERGEMGGDCLNTGCVPSKALLAAAKAAHNARTAARFGIKGLAPEVDYAAVKAHVDDVIATIAPHDSQERFEGMGATVLRDHARFIDSKTLAVGDKRIRARRFVIATGSRPSIPPIEGLETVDYLTNESVFELAERPAHLIIIGGGPIGMEMAQAFVRLDAAVTVLEKEEFLAKDDRDMVEILTARLAAEGVELIGGADVRSVEKTAGGIAIRYMKDDEAREVTGSHLLLAVGRTPNVEDTGLEAAGVETTDAGIKISKRLRTTNRRIYAIGDVTGGYQFTHVAGHEGGLFITNALFRLPVKADRSAIPWVTYTDPELAHVGLSEAEARAKHGDVEVLSWHLSENDRAIAERANDGLIKIILASRGRVVGASLIAPNAGELIQNWCIMMSAGVKLRKLASVILPYPTFGEINKRVAGEYYSKTLFSPWTRRLVRLLSIFG